MLQRIKKTLSAVPAVLALITTNAAYAQYGENIDLGAGIVNRDLVSFVVSIINVVLGFLALIALIIVLVAGFQWMISGGDPKKVESAQKSIRAGIIGIVVIFLAWAIVTFVIGLLKNT